MTCIIEKSNNLSIRPLKSEYSAPHSELLEKLKNLHVPAEYSRFIEHYPATSVFDKEVQFHGIENSPTSDEGKELLEVLFSICDDPNNDLLSINKMYSGQLPEEMLIIGEVTGNNLICLNLSSESRGKIYVWDRDASSKDSCYLVSNSFLDFIESLQENKDNEPQAEPQLKSYSLSENLKAKAAEFLKKQNRAVSNSKCNTQLVHA